jgi:hypothetical protein
MPASIRMNPCLLISKKNFIKKAKSAPKYTKSIHMNNPASPQKRTHMDLRTHNTQSPQNPEDTPIKPKLQKKPPPKIHEKTPKTLNLKHKQTQNTEGKTQEQQPSKDSKQKPKADPQTNPSIQLYNIRFFPFLLLVEGLASP